VSNGRLILDHPIGQQGKDCLPTVPDGDATGKLHVHRAPKTFSTSGLPAQKQLIAVEVLEKHARTPWACFRLAVKNDSASLQALVITNTIGSVNRQKREAASLLAHDRDVVGVLRQFERERTLVARQGKRDPTSVAERRIFDNLEAELLRVELNGGVVLFH